MVSTYGALEIKTNNFILPENANKETDYKCPSCKKKIVLRKGKVKKPHFAHLPSTNIIDPCSHYSNTSNLSEEEKDRHTHIEAQYRLKSILEKKEVLFFRNYSCCGEKWRKEFQMKHDKDVKIELEHRFNYKGSVKSADIAILYSNNDLEIIEIVNTHKTDAEDRPEPWYEIESSDILKLGKEKEKIELKCIRSKKCNECKKLDDLKIQNLDEYITQKLNLYKMNKKFSSNLNNTLFSSNLNNTLAFGKKLCDIFKEDCYGFRIIFYIGNHMINNNEIGMAYIVSDYSTKYWKRLPLTYRELDDFRNGNAIQFEATLYENDKISSIIRKLIDECEKNKVLNDTAREFIKKYNDHDCKSEKGPSSCIEKVDDIKIEILNNFIKRGDQSWVIFFDKLYLWPNNIFDDLKWDVQINYESMFKKLPIKQKQKLQYSESDFLLKYIKKYGIPHELDKEELEKCKYKIEKKNIILKLNNNDYLNTLDINLRKTMAKDELFIIDCFTKSSQYSNSIKEQCIINSFNLMDKSLSKESFIKRICDILKMDVGLFRELVSDTKIYTVNELKKKYTNNDFDNNLKMAEFPKKKSKRKIIDSSDEEDDNWGLC